MYSILGTKNDSGLRLAEEAYHQVSGSPTDKERQPEDIGNKKTCKCPDITCKDSGERPKSTRDIVIIRKVEGQMRVQR